MFCMIQSGTNKLVTAVMNPRLARKLQKSNQRWCDTPQTNTKTANKAIASGRTLVKASKKPAITSRPERSARKDSATNNVHKTSIWLSRIASTLWYQKSVKTSNRKIIQAGGRQRLNDRLMSNDPINASSSTVIHKARASG